MASSETKVEVIACDLKFFLDDQNSDHAWIKSGGWKLLNVETVTNGGGYDTFEQAWLIRTVKVTPGTVEVVNDD